MPFFGRKDPALAGIPENFWIPGSYKRVLRRLKNGHRMINSLMAYMEDRVRADDSSDKQLQMWLNTWSGFIQKNEADLGMIAPILRLINDVHLQRLEMNSKMKTIVKNEILPKLKIVKHYVRKKGIKEIGNDFARAQKDWAKGMKKVEKIKIIYHEACRELQKTEHMLTSGKMHSGHGLVDMSPEVREKMQIRYDEYVTEVDRCRTMYEATLYELKVLRRDYEEGMKTAFKKCSDIERGRLNSFQGCLEMFAKAIDSGRNSVYNKVWASVDLALLFYTVEEDLDFFSSNFGPDMPYEWPDFEEWRNRPSQIYD